MVRFASSPLDRGQAHTVVKYLDELARELPPPERQWRWGDVDLSHEVLYNLKSEGLIQVTERGGHTEWRTIEAAWTDVRDRAGDDVEADTEAAQVA